MMHSIVFFVFVSRQQAYRDSDLLATAAAVVTDAAALVAEAAAEVAEAASAPHNHRGAAHKCNADAPKHKPAMLS